MKRYFALYLILFLLFTACGTESGSFSSAISWQEQYDLGVRYLSESNYEEAIIAFTAAIEIDPMAKEAYIGLANAYVYSGNVEKAIEVLQSAISQIGEDSQLSSLLLEIQVNSEMSSDDKAVVQRFWDSFDQSDAQAVVDLLSLYAGSQFMTNEGGSNENELSVLKRDLLRGKRLAYDGEQFHADWNGKGFVICGEAEVYYGDLQNGVPDGHGVLVAIDTWWTSTQGITACWTESDWRSGKAFGKANLVDYYSSDYYSETSGHERIINISCTFDENEIMSNAEVSVSRQVNGQTHNFVYHVSNGKVNSWNEWNIGVAGLPELKCLSHVDCGVAYLTSNQGSELFQNTHCWVSKNVPHTSAHYMDYGLHCSISYR